MTAARPPVVVVAPDSFKGSLDAPSVCEAIAAGLRRIWPDAEVVCKPIADGGEGTLDAVLAAVGSDGARRHERVHGAAGDLLDAPWGLLEREGGPTAVIEVASIVGITDRHGMRVPVTRRSTRGVGELLSRLLDQGLRHFMIGLGGSSTNDGGAGLLAALGLALVDGEGGAIDPTPEGLEALAAADAGALDARLGECAITIMSDVDNPLCGTCGATAIFGPQKGVAADEVELLDARIERFADRVQRAVGRDVAANAGAGAAGGLGFALQLVGGRFASGAEVIAGLVGLDSALARADWAITGEGRSDRQTLLGKAPLVVARHAAHAGVPVSLLSGAVDPAALPAFRDRFAGVFTLPPGPATLDACLANAADWLADRAEQMALLYAARR